MVRTGRGLDNAAQGAARPANGVHQIDDANSLASASQQADDRRMDFRYPVGKFVLDPEPTADKRRGWIATLDALPRNLRQAVAGLSPEALDTRYRDGGWTVRQVVHHVADSHLNAYTRIKLTLTEDTPTIKPYEEARWAELPDGKTADPAVSLGILDGVHYRLNMVLESLTPEQFARSARHPDLGAMTVDSWVQMYAWHSRHHLAHIALVADR
jgi:DinB superfamily